MFEFVDFACPLYSSTQPHSTMTVFYFSDFRKWNLEGYTYIDSDVISNRHNSSLSRVEDDAEIRGYNVRTVFCLPCSGHYI